MIRGNNNLLSDILDHIEAQIPETEFREDHCAVRSNANLAFLFQTQIIKYCGPIQKFFSE